MKPGRGKASESYVQVDLLKRSKPAHSGEFLLSLDDSPANTNQCSSARAEKLSGQESGLAQLLLSKVL